MMEVEERRVAEDKDNNVGPWLECSICLEAASEPVVTLRGHLYCWPCMFRWLNSRHHGSARCPVCKAAVSCRSTAVAGRPMKPPRADVGGEVPRRPPVSNVEQNRRSLQEQEDEDDGMEYYQGSWESNAECLLGGIALAVLLPRRLHVHLRYGGEWRTARQQRRRLQLWWRSSALIYFSQFSCMHSASPAGLIPLLLLIKGN